MNKAIYMFWHAKTNHFNFGDDINPFIVENLSGKPVKKVMVFNKKKSIIYDFLKMIYGIIQGAYDISVFKEYIRSLLHPDYVVGIGSILHNNFSRKAKIWGTGIIDKESSINKSDFYAVRGIKTVERMEDLGYKFTGKIGDPALLLPLIYDPSIQNSNKIGIIPHVIHFESIKSIVESQENYILIDLSENNIKKTINLIKSCSYIISSSLHGLIVSHAYNTPALHIQLEGKLAGDGIKFSDYFSSVDIKDYKPIKTSNSELLNPDHLKEIFQNYHQQILPKNNIIDKIQRDLLAVAPFELSDEFKIYITDK